jgi:ribosomal protein S18 acetylase RimI-like enzyme
MKLLLRNTDNSDLIKIFNLQVKCFETSDRWYKSIISQYLDNSIVIETLNKTIIAVLLQGNIIPCDKNDIIIPSSNYGNGFIENNLQFTELFGIVMICVHPRYRRKGLSEKLIKKHFELNKDKLLCLNTRNSNINAINLYNKMGYLEIGTIKDKYFLPNEDSKFMIKIIT